MNDRSDEQEINRKKLMSTHITKKLAGKVALVTGGSRGIGAAIAKRLAAEGASVALTYSASHGKADEVVCSIEAAGGKALAIKADAADTEAVRLAVAKTVGTFGGIDILVNNAGIGIMAPIEQFSLDDFEKLIAINVRGLFVATQEAARHMREGGRIIHIGSTNSERMPFVGGSVYALTKGAVTGFTKGLARDLGPRGITVNNVQPGPIDTEMNPADSDFARTLVPITALQRYGNTDEIASFVAYLASPEASYITGASLLADGGFAA
jgi:3-oxoacyl-[acyl-carrier protein] reductase